MLLSLSKLSDVVVRLKNSNDGLWTMYLAIKYAIFEIISAYLLWFEPIEILRRSLLLNSWFILFKKCSFFWTKSDISRSSLVAMVSTSIYGFSSVKYDEVNI